VTKLEERIVLSNIALLNFGFNEQRNMKRKKTMQDMDICHKAQQYEGLYIDNKLGKKWYSL